MCVHNMMLKSLFELSKEGKVKRAVAASIHDQKHLEKDGVDEFLYGLLKRYDGLMQAYLCFC